MALDKLDEVGALLRAHLAQEALVGFPALSRSPSSNTIRFLDYFSTLAAADQEALLDSLARMGAMQFFSPLAVRDQIMTLVSTDPAFLRYREAVQSGPFAMGLRYESLRMVKAMLGDPMTVEMMTRTRATLAYTPRDDMPAALVPDPDRSHVKPAKAPLLRPLINAAFTELFAVGKRKLAGGETGYTGVLDGTDITVWIGFGGMNL